MTLSTLSPISRRLLPLYVSAFLQGLPLWYAIEKLFMTSIGFDTATIGLMVAVMYAVILIVETPSGILADRWSRRGVMLLSVLALLASAIVGGLSYNVPIYILSCVLWGVYQALYSGTYDAAIYDTVVEEHGNADRYEQYLGRLRIAEGAAFVIGAFGGSLIANQLDLRATYFITMPFIATAAIILLRYREPTLHKAEAAEPVFKHIRQTFAAVLRNPLLAPIIIAIVGFVVIQDILFELSQLWFIAVDTPLALYGLVSALLFSTWALGGLLVTRFDGRRGPLISVGAVLGALVALTFGRNQWLLLAGKFVLGLLLIMLGVILSKKMHDQLPSRLRAGSSSVISTLGSMIIIPLSLAFTGIAQQSDIFKASYLLLGLAGVAAIAYLLAQRTRRTA